MLNPFHIYSPEEEIIDSEVSEKNISLFIKRDDKIHPFISGNKWRKLKHQINYAKEHDINNLVTFGGAWSNHILATAAAAAEFGFSSTAFIRGEEINNPVLSMAKLFGMKLKFVDRESYRNKRDLFNSAFSEENSLFIDEGGRSKLGILGCTEIITELNQIYDHIFVASGTGTTAAGILNGVEMNHLNTQIHAVPVLKGSDFLKSDLISWGVDSNKITFHQDYHFSGYAKSKPELINFIKKFISKTGIMIEPTYTGKLFFAIYDLIKKDYFNPGSKILVIHTGGLTGLLGHLDKFEE